MDRSSSQGYKLPVHIYPRKSLFHVKPPAPVHQSVHPWDTHGPVRHASDVSAIHWATDGAIVGDL